MRLNPFDSQSDSEDNNPFSSNQNRSLEITPEGISRKRVVSTVVEKGNYCTSPNDLRIEVQPAKEEISLVENNSSSKERDSSSESRIQEQGTTASEKIVNNETENCPLQSHDLSQLLSNQAYISFHKHKNSKQGIESSTSLPNTHQNYSDISIKTGPNEYFPAHKFILAALGVDFLPEGCVDFYGWSDGNGAVCWDVIEWIYFWGWGKKK